MTPVFSDPAATAIDPAATPHWESIQREILCPLCDYNLRGLVEPRCPECGHRFEWGEVLSQGDRIHPFLFEHQPHRSVWSFFRTLVANLFPRSFWRSVRPNQNVVPGRLVLYWVLLILPGIVCAATTYGMAVRDRYIEWTGYRATQLAAWQAGATDPEVAAAIAKYGSAQKALDVINPMLSWIDFLRDARWNPSQRVSILPMALGMLAWPWLTLASLLIFRWSMAQARIRNGHVLRCIIYSQDALLTLVPITIVTLWYFGDDYRYSWRGYVVPPGPTFVAAVVLLILGYRLVTAYRSYLRFPHALATVVASQVIVGLILLQMYLVWLR